MASTKVLENVLSLVEKHTKTPESFLEAQSNVTTEFKKSTKLLYDFTRKLNKRKTKALKELVIKDFDEEQIWQQLELQNDSELPHLLINVSKALTGGSDKLTIPLTTDEPVVDSKSDSEDSALEDDEQSENEESNRPEIKKTRRKIKSSIVDDKFFKLQDLDEYLNKEDKRESQEGDSKDSDGDDGEEVDLFDDYSEGEEGEESEDASMKYADFFDSPDSDNETSRDLSRLEDREPEDEEASGQEEAERPSKRVKFNLTNDSDETSSLEKEDESKQETESIDEELEEGLKSSLEMRQERLKKRIESLETDAISEKPWQLKGEVTAANRPQNSLLEEFVEFDVTTRPAPVITEKTTLKLEDIIKQRIKDKAWDDVEKKFKPVDAPTEYKKKLVMDQEKSKRSLAQIYEDEYLKQKEAADPNAEEREPEESKEHKEIRALAQSLFAKLDALSNFHHTPKMVQPDIKIVSNIPAISMEEVAPVATSDAALLAPEEIKEKPRGDLIGKAERTKTDMKRERRHKKLKQKEKQNNRLKKEETDKSKPGQLKKMTKKKNSAMIKKLTKNRNISLMDETQKVAKSSTAFFEQLQDQVKSHIKSKTSKGGAKKNKKTLSDVKLKL